MVKVSLRTEQDILRDRMRRTGMTHSEIAFEFARRYQLRPRSAFRLAHGWTLQRAATHINDHAARLDMDAAGRASMTAPYLCEVEHWPDDGYRRRVTPRLLVLLATVYGTDVRSLLDVADRENLPPADRLVIDTMRPGPLECVCDVLGSRMETFAGVLCPVPRRGVRMSDSLVS